MKLTYKLFILIIISINIIGCTKKDNLENDLEIQNFIWKGLNAFYLWQDDVDNLKDNRFNNQVALNKYLSNKDPNSLFESLLYKREEIDKWSWIIEDYEVQEQLFAGVQKSNGMKFGLVRYYENSTEIFAYVQYIVPNSEAESLSIQRGDIIYGIDGQQLTTNNYISLLSQDNYTINLGTISISGTTANVTPNNINITLNKEVLNINPIHTVKTFDIDGHKIGYIFYNQFISNYDKDLNNAFLELKNENITDLILDLRYNGGGSIQTAINLASMITGQFNNQLFAKERWNSKWQSYFEAENSDYLINNFTNKLQDGSAINSLNLNEITIITTSRSASASELVINGLKPYINVNLVGTTTHGKYVGSVTLYDSNSYTKDDKTLNPNHHYAMQPIVLEIVNKLGVNEKNGFMPENFLPENFAELGEIGNPTEPLLEMAINNILGIAAKNKNSIQSTIIPLNFLDFDNPMSNEMYKNLK